MNLGSSRNQCYIFTWIKHCNGTKECSWAKPQWNYNFKAERQYSFPWESPIFHSPKQSITPLFQTTSKAGAKQFSCVRNEKLQKQSYRASVASVTQMQFFKCCFCAVTPYWAIRLFTQKAQGLLKVSFNGRKMYAGSFRAHNFPCEAAGHW